MALNLDHVYGALLVGYSIGAVLFGVATTQVRFLIHPTLFGPQVCLKLYIYHVNFPQDPLWMKLLVSWALSAQLFRSYPTPNRLVSFGKLTPMFALRLQP